jgi:hypothetical protein
VFTRIEHALKTVRQYGRDHPMTELHIGQAKNAIDQALEHDPDTVGWEVAPHSFLYRGAVVWEPLHPFDHIAYNLFASGFREFSVTPGVTRDEIRALLDLLRLDPLRDFAPEDDLATAFWERRLQHIQYRVVTSFLSVTFGDDDEGVNEVDELAEAAQHEVEAAAAGAPRGTAEIPEQLSLEARAAAIAARQTALRAVRSAGALSLDEATRRSLAAELDVPEREWEARFVSVLADVVLEAMSSGRLELVVAPIAAAVQDAVATDSVESVLELVARTAAALGTRPAGEPARRALLCAVFDGATLTGLLKSIARPVVRDDERVHIARAASHLPALLEPLGSEHVESVLLAAARADVDEVKQALACYLERHAVGNEQRLGELLADADLGRARAILSILARLNTDAAKAALKRAENSPLPELRVEAVAVRASLSPEGLRDELARLSRDADAGVRMAALQTMARYKVKEAGPPLVQHIQSSAFHKLSLDERQLALSTLYELSPSRAELLAIELCQKSSMITREAVDDTRIVAIGLLEKTSVSRDALSVLEKTAGKWSNSNEVRAAAGRAMAAVRQRLQGAP